MPRVNTWYTFTLNVKNGNLKPVQSVSNSLFLLCLVTINLQQAKKSKMFFELWKIKNNTLFHEFRTQSYNKDNIYTLVYLITMY